ncbi:Lrp/AsnC family transcriptional regulator [Candidatus Aerophobetes bacterium]|uniref:Lrp/AsnC family transcriptional regulator n=1 Tax=Aerophobetes bacterium TaxID=2030807 RepID=A0A523W558_UNCAE|nr:MAG: Lrp/AsnC family transcriptional regulator [Candidatus Aerophobetes bacterium]
MENVELRDMRTVGRVFLLINVATGKEDVIADKLLKVKEIREVHIVPGDHDLLAVIEVEKGLIETVPDKVGKIVKGKVRKMPGVSHTVTLIPLTSKVKS